MLVELRLLLIVSVEYKTSVTNAISNARKEAEKYADSLKADISKELEDVSKSVDDINKGINDAVADGIITESEKAAIKKMLQISEKEKEEADAKHDELFDNEYLPSAELNAMHKAWLEAFVKETSKLLDSNGNVITDSSGNALVGRWNSPDLPKYRILVNSINAVINSENQEDVTKNVNIYYSAYKEYSTAVSNYQLAINAAIDAISEEYAKDADDKLHETITKETTVLIENAKDSITLLCKTIEENNMHNYIVGGSFPDSTFADGWYATDGNAITTFLSKKCVKLQKTSSSSSYIRFNLGKLKAGTYRVRYKAATNADYE